MNTPRLQQIRELQTVAAAHEWRKAAGELNSMEYLALITRIDALQKLEARNA